MILAVPRDRAAFPTLGAQVCDFIEQNLVFGPGDLRGQPARLDDEKVALIYRMYEVHPKGDPRAGRRRFKRVGISLRKGLAKTELAAWIAACELHPDAPVRCIGWTAEGEPIGGPVTDPYIPLVAYTEEQSDELAYTALRVILELSALKDDFDIGLERILRKQGGGKAVALAAAPDARDGARTTFQHFDETHRFTLPRLIRAHRTMLANIPKRRGADAWTLETTTAPEPGTGSVAEATMDYARAIEAGRIRDARLFYFHREASEGHDLTTDEGLRAAIVEASGPAAAWSDLDAIAAEWQDPEADRRLSRARLAESAGEGRDASLSMWSSGTRWRARARCGGATRSRSALTAACFTTRPASSRRTSRRGFSGCRACWEWPAGLRPEQEWQVPTAEVDATMRALFQEYRRVAALCRPAVLAIVDRAVGRRSGAGPDKVIEWWTNRRKPMTYALKNFATAIQGAEIIARWRRAPGAASRP